MRAKLVETFTHLKPKSKEEISAYFDSAPLEFIYHTTDGKRWLLLDNDFMNYCFINEFGHKVHEDTLDFSNFIDSLIPEDKKKFFRRSMFPVQLKDGSEWYATTEEMDDMGGEQITIPILMDLERKTHNPKWVMNKLTDESREDVEQWLKELRNINHRRSEDYTR